MYDSVLLSKFFLQEINLLTWGHLSCHCYLWLKDPAHTVVLRHCWGVPGREEEELSDARLSQTYPSLSNSGLRSKWSPASLGGTSCKHHASSCFKVTYICLCEVSCQLATLRGTDSQGQRLLQGPT